MHPLAGSKFGRFDRMPNRAAYENVPRGSLMQNAKFPNKAHISYAIYNLIYMY